MLIHDGYGGDLISAGIPTLIDGRGEPCGGEFIKKYGEIVHLMGDEPNLLETTLECWDIPLDAAARGAAGQQAC